ncbi:hypothetical protein GGR42_002659 [Saonia flava]|uniref:Uncharacterized protein n=1 Tax=Saonia flava TaxID=523696 RepID=A0A846QW00_9FLAO|nr:hypothetical protein [Saonia flava]
MLLSVFFAFIGVVLIYFLFVPIIIYVETETNQYYIQLPGLIKVGIESHDTEILRIKTKVFF